MVDRLQSIKAVLATENGNLLDADTVYVINRLEKAEAQLAELNTTDDGGTMERIQARRIKKLNAQLAAALSHNHRLEAHIDNYKSGQAVHLERIEAQLAQLARVERVIWDMEIMEGAHHPKALAARLRSAIQEKQE